MSFVPTARRVGNGPIIDPTSHPTLGDNIQGPSIIEVPTWLPDRLGRFYCYFADHKGAWIRLAYADEIEGPWTVHPPGSLQLADSRFPTVAPVVSDEQLARAQRYYDEHVGPILLPIRDEITSPHIASPDVHVDHRRQTIVMYFHGLADVANQLTRVGVSTDAVSFEVAPATLDRTYLRVIEVRGEWFGIAMPGQLYRFPGGLGSDLATAQTGPMLFPPTTRHLALQLSGDELRVFWTRVGDAPERILMSTIDTTLGWRDWSAEGEVEILRPGQDWEGAHLPDTPSLRSSAVGLMHQLRDPAIVETDGHTYLAYACGGESGIGLAELRD